MDKTNLSLKNLSIVLFVPLLIISYVLSTELFIRSGQMSFVYLDKWIFSLLGIFIILYVMAIPKAINSIMKESSKAKSLVSFFLSLIFAFSIGSFLFPTGNGAFFLESLLAMLGINILLTLIVSYITLKTLKKKNL